MFAYQDKLNGKEALIIKNNPQIPAEEGQIVAVYNDENGNITASVGTLENGEFTPTGGGGGSGLGVFKVAQSITGNEGLSDTLNVWYAHDSGMTWREFVDSEYNPVYYFEKDVETQEVHYSHLFTIDGNTVKMGTYYGSNLNECQEIVGATPDGVIDDTANYTATFNYEEEG